VSDFGPDNLRNTGDDRSLTFYNVIPAYLGKDAFFHTNCDCTQQYKAVELSLSKRMSNRWQLMGSYVWSRLDGDRVLDRTNPNNLLPFIATGRGTPDQPHAFKLLGSYQAGFGITIGANYQALSGLPRDRSLSVPFAQGTATMTGDLSIRCPESALPSGGQKLPHQRSAPDLNRRRSAQCPEHTRRPEQLRRADAQLRKPGGLRRGTNDDIVLWTGAGDCRAAYSQTSFAFRFLRIGASCPVGVEIPCGPDGAAAAAGA
jgi:hypothetical protein